MHGSLLAVSFQPYSYSGRLILRESDCCLLPGLSFLYEARKAETPTGPEDAVVTESCNTKLTFSKQGRRRPLTIWYKTVFGVQTNIYTFSTCTAHASVVQLEALAHGTVTTTAFRPSCLLGREQ